MSDPTVGGTPIVVPVARVLRRVGVQLPYQRTVIMGALQVGAAEVRAGTPIDIDFVLEATGDAIVVSGELRTVLHCECRRCLEAFDEPLVVDDVQEIFQPRPVEGETYPIVGESIDLEPVVRDAVLLALPLAPLCRPDCLGPDPDRFPAVESSGSVVTAEEATGSDGSDGDPPSDPRWAALRGLDLDR